MDLSRSNTGDKSAATDGVAQRPHLRANEACEGPLEGASYGSLQPDTSLGAMQLLNKLWKPRERRKRVLQLVPRRHDQP